jgi:hypothetical protein
MLVVAWNRLVGDLRNGVVQNTAGTACLTFASASTLVALGSLFGQVFITYLVARLSDGGVRVVVLCRESRLGLFNTRQAAASVLAIWFSCGRLDVSVVCCDSLLLLTASVNDLPSRLLGAGKATPNQRPASGPPNSSKGKQNGQ